MVKVCTFNELRKIDNWLSSVVLSVKEDFHTSFLDVRYNGLKTRFVIFEIMSP